MAAKVDRLSLHIAAGYLMVIRCGNNRLRLKDYELPSNFYHYGKDAKRLECKRMATHYRKCGKIIKLFIKATR